MSAFIHWVAVTFNSDITTNDERFIRSFIFATGLVRRIGKAPRKTLNDYYAASGKTLTVNGSLLLHIPSRSRSLLVITGDDCENIEDWDNVREFLGNLPCARITRLDLAVDIENGLSLADVNIAYIDGQFSIKGKAPSIRHHGNFIDDNGEPRTIYIGKRQNGKLFRAYEIGRKLSLKEKQTIRFEVEFSGSRRVIPFDALTSPHPFFCGAYPFLEIFSDGAVNTTDSRKKVRCAQYSVLIEHLNAHTDN